MKISFIIPVYNTKSYIERCINSILSQEFCDYEIIIVDDGSSDDSGVICDAFAERHPQIKVKHIKHSGLGAARNVGIRIAKGDYLLFVDSDDYIERDSLERVIKDLVSDDIVLLRSKKVCKGKDLERIVVPPDYSAFSENDKLNKLIEREFFFCSPCDKAVSRMFIINNEIFFPENRLHEDILWNCKIIINVKTIGVSRAPYYCYEQKREGSLSRSFSILNVIHSLDSIEDALYEVESEDALNKKAASFFLANQLSQIMKYIPMCTTEDMYRAKEIWNKLRSQRPLLKYRILIKLLGFEKACKATQNISFLYFYFIRIKHYILER